MFFKEIVVKLGIITVYCVKLNQNHYLVFFSYFDRPISFLVPILGKRPEFDNTRAKNVFQMEFIDIKKSFIEMAQSMLDRGVCKKI